MSTENKSILQTDKLSITDLWNTSINQDAKIIEFLLESNAIEKVYDFNSLKQARYAWEYIYNRDYLTTQNLLETHRILMLNQDLLVGEKGKFRKRSVFVGNYICPKPIDIPKYVKNYLDSLNNLSKGILSPSTLEIISKLKHVQFEKIHPFIDGNGRVGRILMNWTRINKLGLPILTILEKQKMQYYDWFHN